ncbi:hypothetical protein GCM10029978_018290 [Actinoallomurus acanthiterrae]
MPFAMALVFMRAPRTVGPVHRRLVGSDPSSVRPSSQVSLSTFAVLHTVADVGFEKIFGETPEVVMTVTVGHRLRGTRAVGVPGGGTVFSRKDYEATPGHAGPESGHAGIGRGRTTPLWCCAHGGQVNAKTEISRLGEADSLAPGAGSGPGMGIRGGVGRLAAAG